jgi:uncharacterized protein (TIGR02231 family)
MSEPRAIERTQHRLDAPPREVTVLEDRARVVRRGQLVLPVGQARVIIDGVAPVLVDKSLVVRAHAVGGSPGVTVTVADARVRRRRGADDDAADALAASARAQARAEFEAQARTLARAMAEQGAALSAGGAALHELAAVRELAHRELAQGAARGTAPADAAPRLRALDDELAQLRRSLADRRAAYEDDRRTAQRLTARLAEAHADAPRVLAALEVDVVVTGAADGPPSLVELACEYTVPAACWRPYHRATLAGEQTDSPSLRLETEACVWQRTGEDWRDVTLALSTERPSLGTNPPELTDDVVRTRRRADDVRVEAREQTITTSGLGMASAGPPEVLGVDDGGVTQLLRAPRPATIVADGRPWRVALAEHVAPVELTLIATPERSPLVVRRARASNGPTLLLAGPVDLVAAGGLAGRTRTLLIGAGERFELSAGVEPDLRVHREVRREREAAGVLGSWHTDRVRVVVRLSNLGATARTVQVVERVPVSEIEKVEIVVGAEPSGVLGARPGEARDDTPLVTGRRVDADGLVRWDVAVPAHAQRAVALDYAVRVHTSVGDIELP